MPEIKIFQRDKENSEFADELELKKYTAEVQDRIRKNISADFVLAKLSEQQKTGILKLHSTAEYANKIIEKITAKGIKYEWKEKNKTWKKRVLTKEESEVILEQAKITYDTYMNRLKMISILERNKPANDLLQMLLIEKTKPEENETKEKVKEAIEK